MDTPSCTVELQPTMMKLEDNRHKIIKSAAQSSLMTTIKEEYLTLDIRTLRIPISNPDTETRTIRETIDKLASTLIGAEIRTQINSIIKTDQVTLGLMDQIAGNKLSISSILDQRTQILNTTKTFHRAIIYLPPTQFNLSKIKVKMW